MGPEDLRKRVGAIFNSDVRVASLVGIIEMALWRANTTRSRMNTSPDMETPVEEFNFPLFSSSCRFRPVTKAVLSSVVTSYNAIAGSRTASMTEVGRCL